MKRYPLIPAYGNVDLPTVPTAAEIKALNAAMDNVIGALKWGLSKLKIKLGIITGATWVTGVGALVLTPEAVRGIQSSFPTLENIITRLDTTSRSKVILGELAAIKWIASADEVRKGIASIGREVQEQSTLTLVDKQFDDAASQIKRILSDVPSVANWVLPALGVGAILVGIFVLPKFFGGPTVNVFRGFGGKRRSRR